MDNATRQAPLPGGENEAFLTRQILTYLGNKRALLGFIGTAVHAVQQDLGQDKLNIADLFSGSGIVARFLKQYAAELYVNDLEGYCETVNRCYLANREDVDCIALQGSYDAVKRALDAEPLREGFIAQLYSPRDDRHIQPGERVFYTSRNARYIDTARQLIGEVPQPYRDFLLGPLLYEASVHANTSGLFKGFYKNSQTGVGQFGGDGQNALSRIMADIELKLPVWSSYSCPVHIYREDAAALVSRLPPLDLVYMDPPYNQHPYGSNYFMLNLINDYQAPAEISRVSGIPVDWNKSRFNRRQDAAACMQKLCRDVQAKYLLISFSDDGYITRGEMTEMLSGLGDVQVLDREYNTFRGCRNLNNREIHVKEFLYLVKKREAAAFPNN